jgi:hypothetical protein
VGGTQRTEAALHITFSPSSVIQFVTGRNNPLFEGELRRNSRWRNIAFYWGLVSVTFLLQIRNFLIASRVYPLKLTVDFVNAFMVKC